MATIYEAKMDGSPAVRYFHVPTVKYYLIFALEAATSSLDDADERETLRRSISAILFAAMTIEAFLNDMAEDVVPPGEKDDFHRMRRKYQKPAGTSSVSHKLNWLLSLKFDRKASDQLVEKIDHLAEIRNTLVHYQPADTAGKYILPPPKKTFAEDGGGYISISFIEKPLRVDPPFIQKINPASACDSYNTAVDVLRFWDECCGRYSGIERFPVLTPN